jgi:1,4-alpha-glucan branching enzyme
LNAPLPGQASRPAGFLSFTLHAHLPWVVNHGTWPHGMEWLLEAAAETYLPLLRVLGNLERDGIALHCNLNLSPILLEQLTHPLFLAEFPRYLERKIAAAREDESYFGMMNEGHYAATARFWERFFREALDDFEALGGDIVAGFRRFHEAGLIEIITSGATHGYMPLLGTDESVRAQVRMAVAAHKRHIGEAPRGMWAPECGYRPAGRWAFPVTTPDGGALGAATERIGVEQALAENGIEFFFVDTHLVEQGAEVDSPYFRHVSAAPVAMPNGVPGRKLYQPYFVDGAYAKTAATTVFPRDPQTGAQVWSGDTGYPGDAAYLDFHKKRWPGGHRYWRVTGAHVEMGGKEPYYPEQAAERVQAHASHFVSLVWNALETSFDHDVPPILSSPFDAELFGHWWFEGPQWLEAVARILHAYPTGIALCSATEYLERYPRAGLLAMPEGSWGVHGDNEVWLNGETAWTYQQLYPAELYVSDLVNEGAWQDGGMAERITRQLCRELLLMESSDWQFLITTGAARDYAEMRFGTHRGQFEELRGMLEEWLREGAMADGTEQRLGEIEQRDDIFPDLDPSFWAAVESAGAVNVALGVKADVSGASGGGVGVQDASASEVQKFLPHDEVG